MNLSFTLDMNRSERALQVAKLVPALQDKESRRRLLLKIETQISNPVLPDESDVAQVFHFVWVLRDTFFYERDLAAPEKRWKELRKRWHDILALPASVEAPGWWRHPNGLYNGDPEYVVHPCNREIGWTEDALRARISRYGLLNNNLEIDVLVNARKIMNTECDCLIQTPKRIIVVECKDKSNFLEEQPQRQRALFVYIERLLPRPLPLEYIEISSEPAKTRPRQYWSWQELQA